jgi:6-methylsalicylic acid synthase
VEPLTCSPNGTYLITGGLGILGLEVARWLAGRGAARIVLAGRSGLPPRSQWAGVTDPLQRRRIEAVQALEALGVSVRTVSLDVADLGQMRAALDPDVLGLPPISGVVHAAGVLDNRMVGDLDQASLRRVMRPKIQGALVLDELFPARSLEFCVYFSSVGLLLGLTGQTSYAASNGFLDALAHRRRRAGDRTLSLGWTSWRGMGMAASDAVDQELAGLGAGDISVQEAFRSWDQAARGEHAHVAVVRVLQVLPDGPAVLRGAAATTPDAAVEEPDGLLMQEGPVLVTTVTTLVAQETAKETGDGPDDLERNRPFTELGLDSVMTMAIRRRLQKKLGLRLPATVMWDHPTIDAMGAHLAERVTTSREAVV